MEWSWSSYKRRGWTDNGFRLYRAIFWAQDPNTPGLLGLHGVGIEFYAKHPVLALRAIVASGKDPSEFHGQTVENQRS